MSKNHDEICAVCGAFLQQDKDKSFGILLAGNVNFLMVVVCRETTCLKALLEKLSACSPNILDSFKTINNMRIGESWDGCKHYLKALYLDNCREFAEESMLGGYDYRNEIGENSPVSQFEHESHERLLRIFRETEPRLPILSILVGYGGLFDVFFHYCDARCALSSIFGDTAGDDIFFSREISYHGLPDLIV